MHDQRFAIERLEQQPIVSIRGRPSHDEAPNFFDRSYSALFAYVAEHEGQLAGPALSCTHATDESGIDVEVALPLRAPIPGSGEIAAGEIPHVEAAVTDHVGSYTTLGETYAALRAYVAAQGREAVGTGYEFYVDDPREVPVQRRRTRIALPLREQE